MSIINITIENYDNNYKKFIEFIQLNILYLILT